MKKIINVKKYEYKTLENGNIEQKEIEYNDKNSIENVTVNEYDRFRNIVRENDIICKYEYYNHKGKIKSEEFKNFIIYYNEDTSREKLYDKVNDKYVYYEKNANQGNIETKEIFNNVITSITNKKYNKDKTLSVEIVKEFDNDDDIFIKYYYINDNIKYCRDIAKEGDSITDTVYDENDNIIRQYVYENQKSNTVLNRKILSIPTNITNLNLFEEDDLIKIGKMNDDYIYLYLKYYNEDCYMTYERYDEKTIVFKMFDFSGQLLFTSYYVLNNYKVNAEYNDKINHMKIYNINDELVIEDIRRYEYNKEGKISKIIEESIDYREE